MGCGLGLLGLEATSEALSPPVFMGEMATRKGAPGPPPAGQAEARQGRVFGTFNVVKWSENPACPVPVNKTIVQVLYINVNT